MKTISRYIMTLALLLTAVTGAWAISDPNSVYWDYQTWTGWEENVTTHTVGDITITATGSGKVYHSTSSGDPLALQAGANDAITFTSNGKPFASVAIITDDEFNVAGWTYNSSTWSYEWSGEPTTSVTLSGCDIKADYIIFTFGTAEAPKVYDSGDVELFSLQVGDILMPGVTLKNSDVNNLAGANLISKRYSIDGVISQYGNSISSNSFSIGENGLLTAELAGNGPYNCMPITEDGKAGNAWVVTEVFAEPDYKTILIGGTTYPAPSDVEVTPGEAANTWTFAMPGSDVVLTPLYAPAAKWDVVENVEQLPAALEGIIAGQDAAIVTAGQSAQGTVMYAVTTSAEAAPALTAFSATVPTAKDYDDAATLYVWYYIQGQDTPDGQEATEENTFNDTEICTTPLTVQVLSNKFDITFNAANANTIEAGKATVTVGGEDKTSAVTEGKLQGVKMGSEVKLEAKPGYKFRKVEVKKKAAGKPLANATTEDLGKVVGADGNIYANKDAAEAANTTAAAMICYVNEGHGLALALSDISSYGNSWDNSRTNNEGKTAAELCSAWNTSKAVTGATWKLASLSEMSLMINAAGGYAALRDGFSAVGGTNMIDDYYWVSDESTADYAKNYNFGGGYDMQEFKDNSYQVRACLEW